MLQLTTWALASGKDPAFHYDTSCDKVLLRVAQTSNGGSLVPKRSEMMDRLYGKATAKAVFDRLQDLDPLLNEVIQRIAYDYFWDLPGTTTYEKSLVTVVSLVALEKAEQTRIHFNGFLNSGGTAENAVDMLIELSRHVTKETLRKGYEALKEVLNSRSVASSEIEAMNSRFESVVAGEPSAKTSLIPLQIHIINVAARVAIGEQETTKKAIKEFLNSGNSIDTLRYILIHQIVYCGFPAAMNGFAALKEVQK